MKRWILGAVLGAALVLALGAWANEFDTSLDKVAQQTSEVAEVAKPEEFEFAGGELPTKVLGVFVDEVNGISAVVIQVENPNKAKPILAAPISIELLNPAGEVVGSNTEIGTDPILNSVPSLGPGETVLYVNDTIVPEGDVASARVKATGEPTDLQLQEFRVEGAKIDDSVYGISAVGTVVNPGPGPKTNVRIEAVVRKGEEIVAAGGALVASLGPGEGADFQIFLIGDPTGGELEVWAPAL